MDDPMYSKIRKSSNPYTLKARLLFEQIQESCGQFLGSDPQHRATRDFYPTWWELYLAYALHNAGIQLVTRADRTHPEEGPDLLAENPSVWIEAVMPESGDGADALSEPLPGEVFTVPIDAFVLRLRTAIGAKILKLRQYIESGTISFRDAAIIAVSGGRLPFRFNEGPVPNIVRSVLGVGSPIVEINRVTTKIVGHSIEYRDHVMKKSEHPVDTDVFFRDESAHVSAVLYSSADCVNHPKRPGSDFVLVHNPKAFVPIAYRWLPTGDEYWLDKSSATLRSRIG
jgi:hypothetical protein